MIQDQATDKIMWKIKALIDKANSTDSLAEKQSFMAKAQELLQKYNLETEQVMSKEEVQKQGVEEDKIAYQEDWEYMLLHYIAMNNFCKCVLHSYSQQISIIGKPANVNACLYLFQFFRNAIIELSIKAYDSFLQEIAGVTIKLKKGHKNEFIKSYLMGAVDGVNAKMAEQKKEAMRDDNMRSLMVTNDNAVAIYMEKNYPNLGRASGASRGSMGGGYGAGFRDGKSINSGGSGGNIGGGRKMIG